MLKTLFYFIIILLILSGTNTVAQSLFFKNYNVEHGLSAVQINALHQDSKGYLWCGGYAGIDKFNGKTFIPYTPTNGLADYYINCITEDKNRHIYIGTPNGLSVYNGTTFTNYTTAQGLPSNDVKCMLSANSLILIGTSNGLVSISNNKMSTLLKNEAILTLSNYIGDTILVSTNNGLYKYSNAHIILYNSKVKNMARIARTDSNTLLMTNGKKLFLFKNNVLAPYNPKGMNTGESIINDLYIDKNNEWYVATQNGLMKIVNNVATYYYPGNDLNSNKIYCIINDYEGNKWIGTYNGIYRFKTSAFINYNIQYGISVPFIFGINQTENNDIWFGTSGGGIYNYNGKGMFTNYTTADGVSNNYINCIATYKKNKLVAGTDKGLTIIDNTTKKLHAIKNCGGLEDKKISAIIFTNDSAVYLASGNEIYSNYELIKNNTMPANAVVYKLFQDYKKRVWVCSLNGGIYCIEKNKISNKNKFFSTHCNTYFSAAQDELNNLYFASIEGLFILNCATQKISQLTTDQGLMSNLIYEIQYDQKEHKLYIGSNKGLSYLDVRKLNATKQIRIENYGYNEGFTLSECNSQSMLIDHKNNLWVGTVNGLVYFDKQYLQPNIYPAKLHFTHFSLNDRDTVLRLGQRLDYSYNNITTYVDGICLTNPQSVKYSFLLKGYEKKWSLPSPNNFARYTQLPPGKYELMAKCSNNSNVWNEPISFMFTIKSPWYAHPLALLTYALLVIVGLYFLIAWRITIIRNKEARKTLLAGYELKALRAQMNPHFIFNALNSIQHFVLSNEPMAANKYLSKFAKLVRNILNNSERSEISLQEEIAQLELYLDLEKLRFEELFFYSIIVQDGLNVNNIEIPTMLIQPYVENAILHGIVPLKKDGKILIMFEIHDQNLLKCTIQDNGIGREKAALLKKNSINKHQSAGTRITQNRLALLNKINNTKLSAITTNVIDADGALNGTLVTLYIPLMQYQ
ncbi:MAG: histidine kinase [Bacteroidia bacterium]|nr:histidine kinase [Bacteroidia bacterium]